MAGLRRGSTSEGSSSNTELLESFKRKHLSQNKEIIHKNSELTKANSELLVKLAQLRGENLSLKTAQFKLECELAGIKDQLRREKDESSRSTPIPDQEAIIRPLQSTIETLSTLLATLLPAASALPTPPPSSPPASPASSETFPTSRVTARRPAPGRTSARTVERPRERPVRAAQLPDLSLIAEAEVSHVATEPLSSPVREEEVEETPVVEEEEAENEAVEPELQKAPPVIDLPIPATTSRRRTISATTSTQSAASTRPTARRVPPFTTATSNRGEDDGLSALERIEKRASAARSRALASLAAAEEEKPSPIASTSRAQSASTRSRRSTTTPVDDAPKPTSGSLRRTPTPIPSTVSAQSPPRSIRAPPRNLALETPSGSAPAPLAFEDNDVAPSQPLLASLREEDTDEVPPESHGESQEPDGRRARKSVNYALPKLNTKMRRPEDYVPSIKKPKPRKSHSVSSLSSAVVLDGITLSQSAAGKENDPVASGRPVKDREGRAKETQETEVLGRRHTLAS